MGGIGIASVCLTEVLLESWSESSPFPSSPEGNLSRETVMRLDALILHSIAVSMVDERYFYEKILRLIRKSRWFFYF
jgi:hypothetical protein